jgi:hypothetical protein
LTVSSSGGMRQQTTMVDCAATVDLVSEDFATFGSQMRKSSTKTFVQLVDGQRDESTKVYGISFTVTQHEFAFTFHVVSDLRAADIVLGLPWLDDGQASNIFDTKRLLR